MRLFSHISTPQGGGAFLESATSSVYSLAFRVMKKNNDREAPHAAAAGTLERYGTDERLRKEPRRQHGETRLSLHKGVARALSPEGTRKGRAGARASRGADVAGYVQVGLAEVLGDDGRADEQEHGDDDEALHPADLRAAEGS